MSLRNILPLVDVSACSFLVKRPASGLGARRGARRAFLEVAGLPAGTPGEARVRPQEVYRMASGDLARRSRSQRSPVSWEWGPPEDRSAAAEQIAAESQG